MMRDGEFSSVVSVKLQCPAPNQRSVDICIINMAWPIRSTSLLSKRCRHYHVVRTRTSFPIRSMTLLPSKAYEYIQAIDANTVKTIRVEARTGCEEKTCSFRL